MLNQLKLNKSFAIRQADIGNELHCSMKMNLFQHLYLNFTQYNIKLIIVYWSYNISNLKTIKETFVSCKRNVE